MLVRRHIEEERLSFEFPFEATSSCGAMAETITQNPLSLLPPFGGASDESSGLAVPAWKTAYKSRFYEESAEVDPYGYRWVLETDELSLSVTPYVVSDTQKMTLNICGSGDGDCSILDPPAESELEIRRQTGNLEDISSRILVLPEVIDEFSDSEQLMYAHTYDFWGAFLFQGGTYVVFLTTRPDADELPVELDSLMFAVWKLSAKSGGNNHPSCLIYGKKKVTK
ncbi:MAG: hypothetical protein ABJM43_00910 [Paracoccaceae bacterium]